MNKIIFLCTGNTCRSPMAEGLFRSLGGEARTGLQAASAGLFTVDGLPASENAQIAASELGADLSAHHSRVLTREIVDDAKYLVCMTGAHYDRVLELFPESEKKLFTLTQSDISDPFGADLATYRRCASEIQAGVLHMIEKLS